MNFSLQGIKDFFAPSTITAVDGDEDDESVVRWVPANASLNQILDYYAGSGDNNIWDTFAFNVGGNLFAYPTFTRCVEFIAANCAHLISDPDSLMVLDREGNVSNSRRANAAMDMLTYSPDGNLSAYTWIEDFAGDLVINGNGLAKIVNRPDGIPKGMVRMDSSDAYTTDTQHGIVYTARPSYIPKAVLDHVPERNIVHTRWPLLKQNVSLGQNNRSRFASPPISMVRPATRIGLSADFYIQNWYLSGGNGASTAIVYNDPLGDSHKNELERNIQNRRGNGPLVFGGDAKVIPLNNAPQHASTAELREFQIREVARFFGLPPEVIGSPNEARLKPHEILMMAWRGGLKHYVRRILSEMSLKLLPKGERLEVNPISLVRGDPSSIAPLLTVMGDGPNGTAKATAEEIRRWADLPSRPRKGETILTPYEKRVQEDINVNE